MYSLLEAYQGKGYATEAVQSMIQWVSSSLKRDSTVAYTYPHLKASVRVLEKNGFLFKGKDPEEGTIAYEFLNRNVNPILSCGDVQVEEVLIENNLSTAIKSHKTAV